MTSLQLFQVPLKPTSCSSSVVVFNKETLLLYFNYKCCSSIISNRRIRQRNVLVYSNTDPYSLITTKQEEDDDDDDDDDDVTAAIEEEEEPTPEDIENVNQIKTVLERLRKNRDMIYSEVRLTIMIEDPREVERRRLLGIDDADAPTRDDLVAALDEVNEGKVPKDRVALKMLAEEMINWPNLEVDAPKKKPSKSLYAKTTDTGINPREAAKRLNMDWDSAAEIQEDDDAKDESEVPPILGYGALYLVSAFPVIIGISVVLILFYNSLQ